jgi:hypothetical protein
MISKYLGGGALLVLGVILLMQSQTYNSLPTAAFSSIVTGVAIALLYSV